ncbi:MAG TPA: phytoene desaturase family protein, partial [Isosphaeraceae bacterium]|nr:phytoene desaturase family protein [Isosphaeraceae bacterium]
VAMAGRRVVVVGAGVGGLCAALELRRHGFDVVVLERHAEVGGKAAERRQDGFRWDRGPSIVVMPWVYWSLFQANRLDPEDYLPLRRLDPAFRVRLTDERWLDIPADIEGVREAFGQIDPEAPRGLDRFLGRTDRFARAIGHAYCDRILDRWSQVMLSPLLLSAAIISPSTSYKSVIDRDFQSPAIRELLYGFPTYSGFDPVSAPGSLAIIPWTILREGVWYPEQGGIAEIPWAIARACRDLGVEIRTGVEVEEISVDSDGAVSGVGTTNGHFKAAAVVSNSDYVHTFRMLRGNKGFSPEVESLREGRAEPSESFFTIEMGCDRRWDRLAHHMLVLTSGSDRVYEELFERGEYPSDPPLYLNVTSETDPGDAPEGGSNPFLVVGAPPQKREGETDPEFEARYAEQLLERLEQVGLNGLRASIRTREVSGPEAWRTRFHAFRGAIYGLGKSHNILGGSFRPLNYRSDIGGLYLVGGGVQPGAGLPMVVQSGKLTAARVAADLSKR